MEEEGRVMNATMADKCLKITSQGNTNVSSLQFQQEEADSCLLLHAESYQTVVICFEDTDIFIISVAVQQEIAAPLYTKTRVRMVGITKLLHHSDRMSAEHW